jgi:hypothetical protein
MQKYQFSSQPKKTLDGLNVDHISIIANRLLPTINKNRNHIG